MGKPFIEVKWSGDVVRFRNLIAPNFFQRMIRFVRGRGLGQIAKGAAAAVTNAIKTGKAEGPPKSPVTIALTGSKTKLYDTGGLANSIVAEKDGDEWVVKAIGTGPGDKIPYSEILSIQEEGATIPVSEAMRARFAAVGFPLKAATKVVRIPARPVVEPAIREYMAKKGEGMFRDAVDDGVDETLG